MQCYAEVGGLMEETRCVYVLEFDDGHVKIGYSENPEKRISDVVGGNQADLTRKWVSSPDAKARYFEGAAHKRFSTSRAGGEFFKIQFWDAVEYIDALFKGEVVVIESKDRLLENFPIHSGIMLSDLAVLGPYNYIVLSIITAYLTHSKYSSPKIIDLAIAAGISDLTASKAVANLTELGYIIKERNGRNNTYKILKSVT